MKPNVSREEWNSLTGLQGDAWRIGDQIKKTGGKEIEIDKVKPGNIITMYTGGGSDYLEEAKKSGTDATHVGVVDKINPDGSYYVLHNVHGKNSKGEYVGKEYRNLVKPDGSVEGWGFFKVRNAYSPNYDAVKDYEKKTVVRDNTFLSVDKNKIGQLSGLDKSVLGTNMTERVNTYVKPINNIETKKIFSSKYGIGEDEYQSLAKASLGILAQESNFGTSPKLLPKQVAATVSNAYGKVYPKGMFDALNLKDPFKRDEVSKGASQMKYETNYGNTDLTEFGINKSNFTDDDKVGVVVMDRLANYYKQLVKKGDSKEDAMYKAIEKYNRGRNTKYSKTKESDYVNKILKYTNIFSVKDKENKEYNTIIDKLNLEDNVIKKEISLLN